MSIDYDFYPSPSPNGESEEKKYHLRPVIYRTVQTPELAKYIQASCTLTEADIRAVLTGLSDAMTRFLGDGMNVHLDGIGYFKVSLECKGVCAPKRTRSQYVRVKSLTFKTDKEMNSKLGEMVAVHSRLFQNHSSKLTDEQIDDLLTKYFQTKELMTRRAFQEICGMMRSTAQRHIARLLTEGKLVNINTKSNPIYVAGKTLNQDK